MKRINTMSQFLDHLADDMMPALLERLSEVKTEDISTKKQLLQLGPVETYHHFTIHYGDWRCHVAEFFQFSQRAFIGSDVAVCIFDLVL